MIDSKYNNISNSVTMFSDREDPGTTILLSEMAFSSQNKSMYVISTWENPVVVINASTNNIIKNIPIEMPKSLAYDPINNYVYVASIINANNTVAVINASKNEIIEDIPIEGSLEYIRYNPSNGFVYVTSIINETGTVSIINSTTNKVIKNIPIGDDYDFTFERNLIYNSINGYVYLSVNDRGLQVIKHK